MIPDGAVFPPSPQGEVGWGVDAKIVFIGPNDWAFEETEFMALPPLHPVAIRSAELVATGQVLLALEAPPALTESHRVGGQYAFFQPTDTSKPNPMAIASAVGAPVMMLLMKVPEEKIKETLALEGTTAKMSEATGPGFPLAQAKGRDLLLCTVGSAIAPMRSALMGALARRDQFTKLSLLYGARKDGDLAFADDLDAASMGGVDVIRTLTDGSDHWRGKRGRVQEHLESVVKKPAETTAFVCGMGEMQDEVKAELVKLGVPEDRVLFNF